MANDINSIFLIGRLTKDPELRYTQGGTSVASFSIANNRSYTSGTEKKEQVNFFNCVAWGKTGETMAQGCKKGKRIGVEGRLQQRSWDDKEGKKHVVAEIVVENFQFLDNSDHALSDKPAEPERDSLGGLVADSPEYIAPDKNFSDQDIPF